MTTARASSARNQVVTPGLQSTASITSSLAPVMVRGLFASSMYVAMSIEQVFALEGSIADVAGIVNVG